MRRSVQRLFARTAVTLAGAPSESTGGLNFALSDSQLEMQATAFKFAKEVIAPQAAKLDISME